ncbi:MAG: penicillin-binding transpeptidase domain-containing protein [Tissierellaceae bacterium]
MKFLKKIFNRYNILIYIVTILMFALSFRLATLTIVQGDYYRDISDNKRLKEVYITAPRGEIRDRNGRLLAGNKPSFTVQILKDELNINDRDKKNTALLALVRLLEEDGVSYLDDFPIDLNVFKYNSEEEGEDYIAPSEKVIDLIIEHNLLGEILYLHYKFPGYEDHYQFIMANKAIDALENKDLHIPIEARLLGDSLDLRFLEDEDIEKWRNKYEIDKELSPMEIMVELIDGDKNILRKIIDHPIARKLIYETMKYRGLEENIILEDFVLSFDEDYKNQKKYLMEISDKVTETSSAKEDFVNIVSKHSLNNLLEKFLVREDDKGREEILIPGKILLDMIEEKGIDPPITIELAEEDQSLIYKYTGDKDIKNSSPLEVLIEYSKKADILEEFISHDEIKYLAQDQLLSDGINTRISIANDMEYVFIINKNRWYNENKIPDGATISQALDILKERNKIGEELSPYESRSVLIMYELLNKQGHLAYQPINIAYGIKNTTVAKIEENLGHLPGIQVSIEPVRYYPEGKTAAHILGYLGKISQASEIEKYVNQKSYSPNDLIGKTGIEESFEDFLKGENGVKRVEVDVLGNTTNVLDEKKPVSGNNVYLSLDLNLQNYAQDVLKETLAKLQVGGTYESRWGDYKFDINKNKKKPYENATSGAVVVLDVKTGETLAMVSEPSYDPNLFATGISNTDWLSLFPENEKDPLAPRPLYNVATQTAVQPGSTFKMVTALAALDKGLSPTKKIRDMGYVEIGNYRPACWLWNQSRSTHGYENVYEAIRDSCNYFFYTLAIGRNQRTGESIGVKVEIEDIVNLSKQLGLNDKTGIEINIPAETSGGVPNPQRKIINTKALLKSFLQKNIRDYIKEDFDLDEVALAGIIEEIISWVEFEEPLSRGEVVKRLDNFGLYPEKKLSGEREGLADKIKYSYINQAGWSIADTLNVTIGQGHNSYTPIQMANYIATIANGGYRNKVTLIDSVKNYNNSRIILENQLESEKIELNNYENLEHVKKGMLMVTTEGSVRRVFNSLPATAGTKTGTAQKSGTNPVTGESYDDFTWFVAFAPYDDPEIAVASVIFQGGSGSYAGPMVRDIIAEYLGFNAVGTKESLPFISSLIK